MAPFLQKYTAILYEAANRKNGKNGGPWCLDPDVEVPAFHFAKVCFLRSKGVGFPDLDDLQSRPFRLWNDWSIMAIASTLTQVQKDNNGMYRDVLIGTVGRKNPPALRNVGSPVGEAHAMAFGLSKFKSLLKLAVFDCFSDHVSLKFLACWAGVKGVNWRIFQLMSDYIFRLYTVSTSQMLVSDLVSRSDNIEMTREEREMLGLNPTDDDKGNDVGGPSGDKEDGVGGSSSSSKESRSKQALDLKNHWAHNEWWHNDGFEDDKENQSSVSDTNPASKMRQREAGGHGGESTYLGMLSHGTEIKEGYVEQDIIGETKDWTLDKRTDQCGQEDTETDIDGHKDNTWLCHQIAEITSCKKQTQSNKCTHIKLTFPGLENDNTYRFNCLPFRHRNQVIATLGPKFTEDIFRTISREELIQEQRKDRLLSKVIYFTKNGWPTYSDMKQLYPTRNLLELFFRRHLLTMSVDGMLIMKRDYQEHTLEERVVVPLCYHFQCFLLAHHTSSAFHSSVQQTYLAINFRYYIVDLARSLRYFIARCATCIEIRTNKPNRNKKMPLYIPNFVGQTAQFNDVVYSDASGIMPVTPSGLRYFVIFVCRFSGFIIAKPVHTLGAEEIKRAFLENWCCVFGPPKFIVSDCGSCYTSRIFKKMADDLKIQHKFSNTSVPRSEYAETGIFKLKARLKACLGSLSDHTQWPEALMMAQLSANCRMSMGKLIAPSELACGQPPRLDLAWVTNPGPPKVEVNANEQFNQPIAAENTKAKTTALWKRGRIGYPVSDTLFSGKQDLDLTRLRQNDPLRLMMTRQTKTNTLNEQSMLSIHFLRAGLCEVGSDNQLLIYARVRHTVSNASNSLFPLTSKDIGRYVFRYNPVLRSFQSVSAGLKSAWEGPMVITHVNSEVTCIVEGILRGKIVAYRAPIDHIRPYYDIHLENIPAMKRDEDIEEEEETEKDKRKRGRGKEGEDSETDEDEEEEVNFTTYVNPSRTTDLPVIKTITMKINNDEKYEQEGKEEEENKLALSLLDLPESELICIDPEIELALQGENVDNIKEKIREGSHMEERLLFHKILPFTTLTRKQKMDLDKELHEEFLLMSNRPGSPEETRSPRTEGMNLEWWGEESHHPEEREEEEKEEREGEEGQAEEGGEEEGRTEGSETHIQDEPAEREWDAEAPRDTQDQEKDEEQEEGEKERTEEEEEPVREEGREVEKQKEDTEGEKEMPIIEENPQRKVKKTIKEKWVTRTMDKADNKTDEGNKTDNKTTEDNKTDHKTDEDKDNTLFGRMARMGKRLKGHNKEGDYWKPKGTTRRRKE